MIESIDQSLLLQYVEDELTPAEAEALRDRLRDRPETLDALERLREDRLALRDAPEPALPRDLVAELEPVLARPMLLEPNHNAPGSNLPGSYRRRHNRGMRRRRLIAGTLVSAAAGLAIVVGAGLAVSYAIKNSFIEAGGERQIAGDRLGGDRLGGDRSRPSTERLADAAIDDARDPARADAGRVDADPDAAIHHYAPEPISAVAIAVGVESAQGSDPAGLSGSTSSVLPFTLVVNADSDAALSSLERLVTGFSEGAVNGRVARVALVRNFSYQEAVAIAREERRQRTLRGGSGGRSTPPLVADSRNGGGSRTGVQGPEDDLAEIARFVAAQLKRSDRKTDATSGIVAGQADLTPSFQEQLAISQRGASYTIAVPASQLSDLLRVAHDTGLSTSLRLLPEKGAIEDRGWASDRPRIQRAVRDHTSRSSEHIVLLPIVVRDRP